MSLLSRLGNWFTFGMAARAKDEAAAIEDRPPLVIAPAPLPFVDDAGVLQVAGTDGADVIVLSVDAPAGKVNVVVNDVATQLDLAAVAQINVRSGSGRDEIRVSETVPGEFTLPIVISGRERPVADRKKYANAA